MVADSSVSPHVLKMKGYLDHLKKLGLPISQELVTDIILQTLPDAYDGFVMNYNMHNMEKTISELHGMLKTAEHNINTTSNVLMVQRVRVRPGITRSPSPILILKGKSLKLSSLKLGNQRKGNAYSAMSQVIGKGIASSTWKI